MIIIVLFTIAKKKKKMDTTQMLMNKGMNKVWYIYTLINYSTINRIEILIDAIIRINIMQSDSIYMKIQNR